MTEKKKRGKKPFIVTPAILQQIEDDAANGFNNTAIATGLGVAPQTFSNYKRDHPEIILAIDRGRRRGIEEFMKLCWQVASDTRYGQTERDRLSRLLRVEGTFGTELTAEDVKPESKGFTVTIIPNKNKNKDTDDE